MDELLEPSTSTQSQQNRRRATSWIHNHFTKDIAKNIYICLKCRTHLTARKDGSTGNLHNHLERIHPHDYQSGSATSTRKRPGQSSRQTTLDGPTQAKKPLKEDPLTQDSFMQKLLRFVVATNQPISIVDRPEFRDLINHISKDKQATKIPGRTLFTTKLEEEFSCKKNELISELAQLPSKVSLVLDGWTSTNQVACQGVICRYITDNWELVTKPLDLTHLLGSHTGENLAHALMTVVDDFNLHNKIVSITTDNASNMDTLFQKFAGMLETKGLVFDVPNQRVRCLAHIVNLCAKEAIKAFELHGDTKATIDLLRSGIAAVRATPQRRHLFFNKCDDLQIEKAVPQLDVDVRWNSTFDMITLALDLKDALELTHASHKDLHKYSMETAAWDRLRSLLEFLSPMQQATLMISKETVPNIAASTMIFQSLFTHFDNAKAAHEAQGKSKKNKEQQDWIPLACSMAKAKLLDYYPDSDGKAYVIGTILHPAFKLEWYKQAKWPAAWIKTCEALITSEWNASYKPQPTPSPTVVDPPITQRVDYFGNLYRLQMASSSKAPLDELKKYLTDPVEDISTENTNSLLNWWKERKGAYPNLSRMARDFFTVAGSGVPVERFFSTGTDILTDNRKRLTPEHIKVLMCLRSWMNLGNKFLDDDPAADCVEDK